MAQSEAINPTKMSSMSALNMVETPHPGAQVLILSTRRYEGFPGPVRPVMKKPEASGLLRVHQSLNLFIFKVF
jgi:hypothetical protein